MGGRSKDAVRAPPKADRGERRGAQNKGVDDDGDRAAAVCFVWGAGGLTRRRRDGGVRQWRVGGQIDHADIDAPTPRGVALGLRALGHRPVRDGGGRRSYDQGK